MENPNLTFKQFITNIFKKLSCCHKWELLSKTEHIDKYHVSLPNEKPLVKSTTYVFTCKKCGKIRKFTV